MPRLAYASGDRRNRNMVRRQIAAWCAAFSLRVPSRCTRLFTAAHFLGGRAHRAHRGRRVAAYQNAHRAAPPAASRRACGGTTWATLTALADDIKQCGGRTVGRRQGLRGGSGEENGKKGKRRQRTAYRRQAWCSMKATRWMKQAAI